MLWWRLDTVPCQEDYGVTPQAPYNVHCSVAVVSVNTKMKKNGRKRMWRFLACTPTGKENDRLIINLKIGNSLSSLLVTTLQRMFTNALYKICGSHN